MAEFNVLKEYAMMVKANGDGVCTIECINCPISGANNGENKACENFMRLYPEKATEIIRKWSEDHPKKTRGDLVLEHFPHARLSTLSPCDLFGEDMDSEHCNHFEECDDCRIAFWNEVVE